MTPISKANLTEKLSASVSEMSVFVKKCLRKSPISIFQPANELKLMS